VTGWPKPIWNPDVVFLPVALPAMDFLALSSKAASLKEAAAHRDWYSGESEIDGTGVFAGRDFAPGEIIGVAMTDGGEDELGLAVWNLTFLARFCNHQKNSNTAVQKQDGVYMLVASRPISRDEEITADYYQVSRELGPGSVMKWNGSPVPRRASVDSFVELSE
jgi:hypothetical protein